MQSLWPVRLLRYWVWWLFILSFGHAMLRRRSLLLKVLLRTERRETELCISSTYSRPIGFCWLNRRTMRYGEMKRRRSIHVYGIYSSISSDSADIMKFKFCSRHSDSVFQALYPANYLEICCIIFKSSKVLHQQQDLLPW